MPDTATSGTSTAGIDVGREEMIAKLKADGKWMSLEMKAEANVLRKAQTQARTSGTAQPASTRQTRSSMISRIDLTLSSDGAAPSQSHSPGDGSTSWSTRTRSGQFSIKRESRVPPSAKASSAGATRSAACQTTRSAIHALSTMMMSRWSGWFGWARLMAMLTPICCT